MLVASFAGAQQVRILVQSSPLAGFQFHAGARIWEQLRVGDALALTREADNAHDSNAVRVDWQGIKLGYLPRSENRAVAAAMDGGARVEGRVAALKQARDPWQRIRIDVMATPD
jgi:hypothetical protein